ncbi:MAG: hypothetical protein ACX932_06135, partial [Gammaproteobacteria bacterium]
QCLNTWMGHTKSVSAVTVLPDGSVVSGSWDNTLRHWDPQTGQCLNTWTGHTSTVWDVTVLPDGTVVSGSRDNTLRHWDPKTGQCLNTWRGHTSYVFAVTVLPDGSVVSGGWDNTLRQWPRVGPTLTVAQLHEVLRALSANTSVTTFNVSDALLPEETLMLLAEVVKNHRALTSLTLENCGLNNQNVYQLLRALDKRAAKALQPLTVSFNLCSAINAVDIQYALGQCYIYGINVIANEQQSVHWLTQAAEQGHGLAQWLVGLLYATGIGAPANKTTAQHWFTLARECCSLTWGFWQSLTSDHSLFVINKGYTPYHLMALAGAEAILGLKHHLAAVLPAVVAVDSEGYTPKALAIAQLNHYRAQRTALVNQGLATQEALVQRYEGCVEKLKRLEKEYAFQQFLHEQALQEQTHVYYEHEAHQLQEKLMALTVEDGLATHKKNLYALLNTLEMSLHHTAIDAVMTVLKQVKPPQTLLQHKKTVMRWFSSPWKPVCQLIQTLQGLLNSPLLKATEYQPLREGLQGICQEYQGYVDALTACDNEAARQALYAPVPSVMGLTLGHRQLTPEVADALVPVTDTGEEKGLTSEEVHGTHTVKPMGGIHFKKDPHAPGVEYTVDALNKLIAGEGSPPTALLQVTRGKVAHTYLASKTVDGANLQYILEEHPEYLARIEPYNFSAMMVSGLLVNPQDGKPDNYMTAFTFNKATKAVETVKIIGIDNDIAFADPIVKQHHGMRAGTHFVNVKNVLYFFPQMAQPIDPVFRDTLLNRPAELLLVDWLEQLMAQNTRYATFLSKGILTQEAYDTLRLPIQFVPGTVTTLYDRLCQIQQVLRDHPEATHSQLFHAIMPSLAAYYDTTLRHQQQQNPDGNVSEHIQEALIALYLASAPTVESMAQLSKVNSEQRAQLLTGIAYHNAGVFDFEGKRIQSPEAALEEMLAHVNFHGKLGRSKQKLLLQKITGLPLQHLTLRGMSALEGPELSQLLAGTPTLKQLHLWDCGHMTPTIMETMAKKYSNIQFAVDYQQACGAPWDSLFQRCSSVSWLLLEGEVSTVINHHTLNLGDILANSVINRWGTPEIWQQYQRLGVNLHHQYKGQPVLHIAAAVGNIEALDWLLSQGDIDSTIIDIYERDRGGYTALDRALKNKQWTAVQRLQEKGVFLHKVSDAHLADFQALLNEDDSLEHHEEKEEPAEGPVWEKDNAAAAEVPSVFFEPLPLAESPEESLDANGAPAP